jgi:hypothetical protein
MKNLNSRLSALEKIHLPEDLEERLYLFCFADWLCVPSDAPIGQLPDSPTYDEAIQVSFDYRKKNGETRAASIKAFRQEMISLMPRTGGELLLNVFDRHSEEYERSQNVEK